MSLLRTKTAKGNGPFPGGALLWLWAMIAAMVLTSARSYGAATASETEVKAAFLYNASKFVEWPATAFTSTNAPIQLAIYGDSSFSAELKNLFKDKKAHGRAFEVKSIISPQEAKGAHIVFVASTESRRATQVLEATRKLPVLTVGESDQFLDQGGMINLIFEDAQLAFEVNPEPAQKVQLEISSKLLRLGRKREAK
jgi:hypothetical protein